MGNALVVLVVPEEQIAMSALVVRGFRGKMTPVESDAIWQPPTEPWREHGPYWFESARLYEAHTAAAAQSLESFLNDKLLQLDGMVRTGYWILDHARACVSLTAQPVTWTRNSEW